jgi:hypothetical protein
MSSEINQGQVPAKPARPAGPGQGAEPTDLISTLEAQLSALKNARQEQARADADLLERQAAVARREAELGQLAGEVERRAADVKASETELTSLRERLAQERREIESLSDKIRAERESLQRLMTESGERARSLEQQARELAEREAAARQQTERADKARREHEEATAELTQRLSEAERAAREREKELAESSKSLDDAISHATQRAAELAKDREKFEIERQAAAARTAEREKALAGARAELDKVQAELRSKSGAAAKAESAQLAALQAQLKERDAAAQQLAAERERLESELRAAGNRLAELEEQSRASGEKNESLLRELKEARAGAGAGEADSQALEELQDEVDKRDRAIEALRAKLEEAKGEIEALQHRLESAGSGAPQGSTDLLEIDARLALRRDRLHRYKTLLRDQSSKILQARSALAKRAEQCDQVLAKRAELAQAKQALDARAARVDRSAARNKAAVAVLSVVASLAVLAGLSWAVAKQLFPGQYLVQATIAAQPEGQALTPEQLGAWQQSMMALTLDPVVMETVAERMKKRGMLDLSTPGEAMARFKEDLDASASAPGELILSLRGTGAETTRRTLDTFLAAFIAIANESRSRRADQATTAMTVKPSADVAPVEEPHLFYAGAIWASSSALVLALGGVLWARLASARRKYEEIDPIQAALELEQAGWATVERS